MARAATAAARPARARSERPSRPAGRSAKQTRRRPASKLRGRRLSGLAGPIRRPALAAGTAALPVLRSPFARSARAGGGRLLDALVAGHGWIALVFVLLAGLVFFNVDLLQLNRQIATGTDKAADLRRANASLRVELAKLGSSERIQREAAAAGFVLPAPGDVVYLTAAANDARRALRLMTTPQEAPAIPPPLPEPVVEEPPPDTAVPVAEAPPAVDPAAGAEPVAPDPATGAVPPAEPVAAGPTGAPTAPAG
jgi:cell division protein FtsL